MEQIERENVKKQQVALVHCFSLGSAVRRKKKEKAGVFVLHIPVQLVALMHEICC